MSELQAQNEALARRLAALESAAPAREAAAPASPAERRRGQQNRAPPAGQQGALPAPAAAPSPPATGAAPSTAAARSADPAVRALDQRVRELEIGRAAQEAATRSIIRDTITTRGANINQNLALSGAVEARYGRVRDFSGPTRDFIELSTAELDFDIRVGEWATGSLIVAYDPGTNVLFPTIDGSRAGVDRFNVDRATITLGDTQRFPLYARAGRDVLPFGSSTGIARADSLSISGPLSTDLFESRQDHIALGFALPTPDLGPQPPGVVVPPVQSVGVSPLFSSVSRWMGYRPPPTRPQPLSPTQPAPMAPPFYGSAYVFNGDPDVATDRRATDNYGATIGYRTQGSCGESYDNLRRSLVCPWAFDFHVDYVSSVFDSNFLRNEYRRFLPRIGTIDGVAAVLRTAFGPFSLVAEYSQSLGKAKFTDDGGRSISITPAAWQLGLGYQFDWNPWVEKVGDQGTFVAITWSGTSDMAGISALQDGSLTRVGNLPRQRLALTAGEWIMDGVKLAGEFLVSWDYAKSEGGTGNVTAGVLTSLTLNY